jgi:hypothetical protein
MDPTASPYYLSPAGDDQATGTREAPLRTVAAAVARASSEHRPCHLTLLPGLYPPLVLRDLHGTAEGPIVIRGSQPVGVDFSVCAELEPGRMEWRPAREGLDRGTWQLPSGDGLAIIEGSPDALSELVDCSDLRVENLVFYNGRVGLALRRCQRVTIADCVLTGEPAKAVLGIAFRIHGPEDQPNRAIKLERVLAYNLKECGFSVEPGALFESCWESCIAHAMQSDGGDGFSFSHVVPTDKAGGHPNRVFADGINYGITLRRCLALRNRLDGFDLGQGVGGVTLELCLGDGNAWGAWHSKDLKVWSGNNRLLQCRMTGRTLFVQGSTEMRGFMSGASDFRVGYGPASGAAFARPLQRPAAP